MSPVMASSFLGLMDVIWNVSWPLEGLMLGRDWGMSWVISQQDSEALKSTACKRVILGNNSVTELGCEFTLFESCDDYKTSLLLHCSVGWNSEQGSSETLYRFPSHRNSVLLNMLCFTHW